MHYIIIFFCFLLSSQAFAGKRVVVISWDGFRPDFLTSDKFKTPNARKLMNSGAYSLDLEPINPTLTYPNHTTMVTGVPSSVHGILSNTVFDTKKGPLPNWYWESDKIKTTTVWKQAFDQGMKTSILGWPVTVGAKATWLLPEVFAVAGTTKTNEDLIRAESGAEALKEIETAIKSKIPTDNELAHDQWITKAAVYLENKHHPDLQLVHLVNVDHWQHETGKYSKETIEAVEEMDREIGEISASLSNQNACIIVLGDHGHAEYNSVFNINVILKRRGLIQLNEKKELLSWKAIAHSSGSQAAIYVKNKSDRKSVLKILNEELKDGFQIFSPKEFKPLHIYPDADFVVISKIGYALSGGFKDTEIETQRSPKATHGYLGSDREMKTVFLASGCGIKPKDLGKMSMLQVAPTIARLLGIKLKAAHGKAVLEISSK
jgi:predicted AlkP superfamily pyrophosphatase or phosphodiesterase